MSASARRETIKLRERCGDDYFEIEGDAGIAADLSQWFHARMLAAIKPPAPPREWPMLEALHTLQRFNPQVLRPKYRPKRRRSR